MAGSEFIDRLDYYGRAWMPARDQVLAAVSQGTASTDKLIIFERSLPWKVSFNYPNILEIT